MIVMFLLSMIFWVTCTIRLMNTQINRLMHCWNPLLLLFRITEILRFVGQMIGIDTGFVIITILAVGFQPFVRIGKIVYSLGQMVIIGTRMAIFSILGLEVEKIPGFVEIFQDDWLAIPGQWGTYRNLIYVVASALVFFTQSHLIVGAVCIGGTMEILIDRYRHVRLEYVFVFASILSVVLLCGYIALRARILYTWIANQLTYCWNSRLLLFLRMIEILRFVGQKIGNQTGFIMISFVGFGIPGFLWIGKILFLVSQKADMGTRVTILTILGLETHQDGLWGEFRTLFYVLASALMIFTQSHLIVGAACAFAAMEILIDKYCHLPLEFFFVGAFTLLFNFVHARAHQRRIRHERSVQASLMTFETRRSLSGRN